MKIDVIDFDNQPLLLAKTKKHAKKRFIFHRFDFFACMNICMILAFFTSQLGGSKGLINGNYVVWYFALPLVYLEAGLVCNYREFLVVFRNGRLLVFLLSFIYILVPTLSKVANYFLLNSGINPRLLKGIQILYCLPPPFSTSLVLSRIAHADIPTSIVSLLICRFGGLLLSPILLYAMLGTTVPPLSKMNLRESVCSTLIPLAVGMSTRSICLSEYWIKKLKEHSTQLYPRALLLLIAYNLFCDACTIDAASLFATDILLCVLIAFLSQIVMTCICWTMCSKWLCQEVLLASIFTCTYKSISFGEWLIQVTFRSSEQIAAINLPLGILTVAQLLLGSLLACWLAPD